MLTKKEVCNEYKTTAVCDEACGIELKMVEYGIEDYLYVVAGTMSSKPSYHKLKVYYEGTHGPYIKLYGQKIYLYNFYRI